MNEREYHRMNDGIEGGELCAANLTAILDCWGVKNVERLDRAIYKYTPCGPHLSVLTHDGQWRHSGNLEGIENGNVRSLLIGSIIEGSEASVTADALDLLTDIPTENVVTQFNDRVDWVNTAVDVIRAEEQHWGNTHA